MPTPGKLAARPVTQNRLSEHKQREIHSQVALPDDLNEFYADLRLSKLSH